MYANVLYSLGSKAAHANSLTMPARLPLLLACALFYYFDVSSVLTFAVASHHPCLSHPYLLLVSRQTIYHKNIRSGIQTMNAPTPAQCKWIHTHTHLSLRWESPSIFSILLHLAKWNFHFRVSISSTSMDAAPIFHYIHIIFCHTSAAM